MSFNGYHMAGGGHSAVDPNDIMSDSFQNSYHHHNYGSPQPPPSHAFATGSAVFGDDELLEGLSDPSGPGYTSVNHQNMPFSNETQGMPIDQAHFNGYSKTPDGDPVQSPIVHGFTHHYQQMQQHAQSYGGSLHSPVSYAGSPLINSNQDAADANYLKARARATQAMQRKASTANRNNHGHLTHESSTVGAIPINNPNADAASGSYAHGQSMAAESRHEKTTSGQWIQTPNSLSSFPGSAFSSPMQSGLPHNAQISEFLMKTGASMPAKLGGTGGPQPSAAATATTAAAAAAAALSSQEAKRKRRRESHNLVERRRRDNINERIQDLSKLVPTHRLEDEKVRKALQSGTPMSPGAHSSSSASGMTNGVRRANSISLGASTTGGLPVGLSSDDKDKGPNKGDILNGAVTWMRDLMWMLHLKLQQQEELMNCIADLGGHVPFDLTDDERRMQTELLEAMSKNDAAPAPGALPSAPFSYSRTAGSGLRVPHHTDYRGDTVDAQGRPIRNAAAAANVAAAAHHPHLPQHYGHPAFGQPHLSGSPENDSGGDAVESVLDYEEDDPTGGQFHVKEEDEFGMDLTQ